MWTTLARRAAHAALTLLLLTCLTQTAWAQQQPMTFYAHALPGTPATLSLIARNPGTTYTVTRLDNNTTLSTGTVANALGLVNITLPAADLPFKVVTSDVMIAHVGADCCMLGGQLVFPTSDGASRIGRDFIIRRPVAPGASNVLAIGAVEDAAITIRDANSSVVASNTLGAGELWTEPAGLVTGAVYTVTATGNITVQVGSGNGIAVAPSIDSAANSCHNDSGLEHFFYINNWSATQTPRVVAYNHSATNATVILANLATGTDFTINLPGNGVASVAVPERGFYRSIADQPVTILAGDSEGATSANPIDDLGDDADQYVGVNQGRSFRLRSQNYQTRIFSRDANNVVTVNGAASTLGADGRLTVNAQQDLTITSTQPIIVQAGGGNGPNDWGFFLRPVQRLDSDNDGVTDAQEGGGCLHTALDNNNDNIPDFLQPNVPGPLTLTVTAPANNSAIADPMPIFEGTTFPDSTVTFTVTAPAGSGIAPDTTLADATGDFLFSFNNTLPDAAYTVRVTATDPFGRTTSRDITFRVDTVAPAAAITAPAEDSATRANPVNVTGTAEAGASISVLLTDSQGMMLTRMTTAIGGAWSVSFMGLAEGQYSVSATATDAAGNATNVGPNAFIIDRTNPTATIDDPATGTRTNDTTPTISGMAADDSGDAASVSVRITNAQGMQVFNGPATFDQAGWTITISPALAQGTYTVIATALDAAGNQGPSAPITLIIDTTPPAVAITVPANNARTNDTTPTVSGTAEAGSAVSVEVRLGNMVVFTSAAPLVASAWTVEVGNVLAEGTYTVTATATDVAGNAATTAARTFIIDLTPPTVSIAQPAQGSATSDNTPTLSGAAEAGASVRVEVYNAQSQIAYTTTVTASAQGMWTATATTLPDGNYTVVLLATDVAGNTAGTTPRQFTVDTTAPTVVITSPGAGTTTNDSTPTISGTTSPNATVSVVIDQLAPATVTADPAGAWSYTPGATLGDGMHTARATATDAAGNVGQPASVTFTINTSAPTLTITAPVANSFVRVPRPMIAGQANASAVVTLAIRGPQNTIVTTGMATANAQGAWTFIPSQDLTEQGAHRVEATTTNQAGSSANAQVSFTFDSVLLVTITQPADGAVTNDTTPTVVGTVEIGATLDVAFVGAGGVIAAGAMVQPDAQGGWSFTPSSPLADGDYTVRAAAQDLAGNMITVGKALRIDTTAGALAITSPADGSVVGQAFTVTGSADPGAEVILVIRNAQGAQVFAATVNADMNGLWSATPPMLIAGDYTASATSTDMIGNESMASTSFRVDGSMAAVAIASPADQGATNDTTPLISGTATPGAVITISLLDAQGASLDEGMATADAQGAWSYQTDATLADATYSVRAVAAAPNGATATDTNTFAVDTVAPTLVVATPTAGPTNVAALVVSGSADAGATVTITVDGMVVATVTADAGGMWTTTLSPALAEGAHTVVVEARDPAGNTAANPAIAITVDTTAPEVVVTSPEDGGEVDSSTPTLSGTAEPGSTVTVTVDGEVVASVVVGQDGMWEVTLEEALAEGSQTLRVDAIDAAGNMSRTVRVDITVDTSGPAAVAITSPANNARVDSGAVTVTGTGKPSLEVIVFVDGTRAGATSADAQGAWSTSIMLLPGQRTIRAEQDGARAEIVVTVVAPDDGGGNSGGAEDEGCGCASSRGGRLDGSLLLFGAFALVGAARRRRR